MLGIFPRRIVRIATATSQSRLGGECFNRIIRFRGWNFGHGLEIIRFSQVVPASKERPVLTITRYKLPSRLIIANIGLLLFVAPLAAQTKNETTVLKPVLPSTKTVNPSGVTYVALENGLDRVQKGEEPRTLVELHAMERQQSKVAEKINAVTVNVQQGPAQGSGVIITPDGYVLTAAHVAGRPGREAWIILSSGKRVRARTLGINRTMDAGLVKIIQQSDQPWPYATLGQSSKLQLGTWVIAAGHPGGWIADRPAVIRIGRVLNNLPTTLVTDCALIGGDSGGPSSTSTDS